MQDNLFMQSLHIVVSTGFENFLRILCRFISLDIFVGSNPTNSPNCLAVRPCSNPFTIVCLFDKSKCLPLFFAINFSSFFFDEGNLIIPNARFQTKRSLELEKLRFV